MAAEITEIDWYSFLALNITVDDETIAVPYFNFSYRIDTNQEYIHLPNQWLAGWHILPPAFEASFSIYVIGNGAKQIAAAQKGYKDIEVTVARKGDENQWSFETKAFSQGRIISIAGSGYGPGEIPVMAVDARFRNWSYTPV